LNRLSTKAAPSEPTITYSYDLAGHPLGIVDNSSSIVVPSTVGTVATLTSTYDSLNNLTGSVWGPAAAQTAPSASSAAFTYLYDKTNRRVSQTTTDNSYWSYPAATASTVSYTANNLDQYSAIGSVTPTYDGNGNLTSDGTFTYGYDAESRLISAVGPGITAAYAYDAQGRRKSKTVNGATTIFVQDPQGRALLDYDGASGTIQNWYAFGSGPNDVLNQINLTGSTRATYIPDIQGSIVASLDASSGALTKAGYQAYGESSATSGTFRYTGARIDAETNGLYDFRARIYSPALGRFMQADPIGYGGGSNLYRYVRNDPLNLVDMLGLSPDMPLGSGTLGSGTQDSGILGSGTAGGAQAQANSGGLGSGGCNEYCAGTTPASIIEIQDRGRTGLVRPIPDPGNPFSATPEFMASFTGSLQEQQVATQIIAAANGAPAREVLFGSDPKIQLPGGGSALYYIYSVGPPDNPGAGRIANVPGSPNFYYSPNHYGPTPLVPNTWVQFRYPVMGTP
jgi:RHS repeat-associated protein